MAPKKKQAIVTPDEAISSAFDKFITNEYNKHGASEGTGLVDVLTFCDKWLGVPLEKNHYLRIVLKLFYFNSIGNENLEITDEDIQYILSIDNYQRELYDYVGDAPNGNEWLYDKAIKIKNGVITRPFQYLVMALGRRAGKTFASSMIICYEIYKLLEMVICPNCNGDIKNVKDMEPCPDCGTQCMNHPQAYYHLLDSEPLRILMCATTKAQAIDPGFNFVRERVLKCPYFDKRVQFHGERMNFLTKVDVRRNNRLIETGQEPLPGSILVKPISSNTGSAHGTGSVMILFDEFALFPRKGKKDSDADAMEALRPQTLAYRHRNDGRMLMISMPTDESGEFNAHFQLGRDKASIHYNNILNLQMSTWEFSCGRYSREACEELAVTESKEEGITFERMYGAQFSKDSEESFIPASVVDRCFDDLSRNVKSDRPIARGANHFMHIDCAFNTANYAYVILHHEKQKNFETGRTENIYVQDDSGFWKPNSEKIDTFVDGDTGEVYDINQINEAIAKKAKAFRVSCVSYDNMQSMESKHYFRRQNLNLKQIHFSGGKEAEMYGLVRSLMMEKRLICCSNDWQLRAELKALKSRYTRNGFRVFSSITSDVSDCLAGACFMSSTTEVVNLPRTYAVDTGAISRYSSGSSGIGGGPSGSIKPKF